MSPAVDEENPNPVREKLVEALKSAKAPEEMIIAAENGQYDDHDDETATPIVDLIQDCTYAGLDDIATRAMHGEFDAR